MTTYDNGGDLLPGVTTYRNVTGAPIEVRVAELGAGLDEPLGVGLFQVATPMPDYVPPTAEQVQRGLAWVKAHYRDGMFQCPHVAEEERGDA